MKNQTNLTKVNILNKSFKLYNKALHNRGLCQRLVNLKKCLSLLQLFKISIRKWSIYIVLFCIKLFCEVRLQKLKMKSAITLFAYSTTSFNYN